MNVKYARPERIIVDNYYNRVSGDRYLFTKCSQNAMTNISTNLKRNWFPIIWLNLAQKLQFEMLSLWNVAEERSG